jgi:hypothetical protein
MLAKSFYRTLTIVTGVLLILVNHAAGASLLSPDKYISTKRSLSAITDLASVKYNPSLCSGKIIELTGKVSGTMKSGNTTSFLLNDGTESYVIKTGLTIPDSLLTGSTLRVLAKVGPGCTTSLSDLTLAAVATEFEVANREKEWAARVQAVGNRGSDPTTFLSARHSGEAGVLSSRAMQIYDPYRNAIAKFNPRLTAAELDTITSSILLYSEHYGVDPRLIIALIIAESNFKPDAMSRCGAMGLCQLMPGTAQGLGVSDAFDPEQNIAASVKLIRGHLDKFGSLKLALSAYNAGAGAVKRHGGVPPYKETRNYIAKIERTYKALCGK